MSFYHCKNDICTIYIANNVCHSINVKMTYTLFTLQIMHVIQSLKNDICTIHIANNACHSTIVKMTYALFT